MVEIDRDTMPIVRKDFMHPFLFATREKFRASEPLSLAWRDATGRARALAVVRQSILGRGHLYIQ
jgi:hypothetical protein